MSAWVWGDGICLGGVVVPEIRHMVGTGFPSWTNKTCHRKEQHLMTRYRIFHTAERHGCENLQVWSPVIWWNKICTFKSLNPAIHRVECDFQKKKKKTFLASNSLTCSEQNFSLWREEKKRSEACLAEEALEGGGNCHLYLQPSQTPRGLLSRWPLLKLSEATHTFFATLSINRHCLTLIQPHRGCESCAFDC